MINENDNLLSTAGKDGMIDLLCAMRGGYLNIVGILEQVTKETGE